MAKYKARQRRLFWAKRQVNAVNQQGNFYGRGQSYQYGQHGNERSHKSSMNGRRRYLCSSPSHLQRECSMKTHITNVKLEENKQEQKNTLN